MHSIQLEIDNFQKLTQNLKDKQALALYKKVEKSSLSKEEKQKFVTSLHASEGLRSIQEFNSKIANSWGLEFVHINAHIRMSRFLGVYAVVCLVSKLIVTTIVSTPSALKNTAIELGLMFKSGVKCLFKSVKCLFKSKKTN
jgi:hypothetical protein